MDSGALVRLRETYLSTAASSRYRVGELIPLVFANPYVTVGRVEQALAITNQGARKLIQEAQSKGWLTPLADRGGRGRRQYWLAEDVLSVVDSPPTYSEVQSPA